MAVIEKLDGCHGCDESEQEDDFEITGDAFWVVFEDDNDQMRYVWFGEAQNPEFVKPEQANGWRIYYRVMPEEFGAKAPDMPEDWIPSDWKERGNWFSISSQLSLPPNEFEVVFPLAIDSGNGMVMARGGYYDEMTMAIVGYARATGLTIVLPVNWRRVTRMVSGGLSGLPERRIKFYGDLGSSQAKFNLDELELYEGGIQIKGDSAVKRVEIACSGLIHRDRLLVPDSAEVIHHKTGWTKIAYDVVRPVVVVKWVEEEEEKKSNGRG